MGARRTRIRQSQENFSPILSKNTKSLNAARSNQRALKDDDQLLYGQSRHGPNSKAVPT